MISVSRPAPPVMSWFGQKQRGISKAKPIGSDAASGSSAVSSSGQGVNTGGLLAGLKHESKVRPNTGSAVGNQGVSDFAKAGTYQDIAAARRDSERKNAELQQKQEGMRQQAFDQNRALHQAAFKVRTATASNQYQMADALRQHQQNQYWDRRNFLLGLIE